MLYYARVRTQLKLCALIRIQIYWRTYLALGWRNTKLFHMMNGWKNWIAWITFLPAFGFVNSHSIFMFQVKGNCSRKPFQNQILSQGTCLSIIIYLWFLFVIYLWFCQRQSMSPLFLWISAILQSVAHGVFLINISWTNNPQLDFKYSLHCFWFNYATAPMYK